jgi:hypothetical protein
MTPTLHEMSVHLSVQIDEYNNYTDEYTLNSSVNRRIRR